MKIHIAVIGAGAMGGWTALMLHRAGHKVTLLDAFGAGNSRSSSGDETRVIRSVYSDKIYAEMANRAGQIWQENETTFGRKIFHQYSVLNLVGKDPTRLDAAIKHFDELGYAYENLSKKEAAKRFPYINLEDINEIILENNGGYLLARSGCHEVQKCFVIEKGDFKITEAIPLSIVNEQLQGIKLSDGSVLQADAYVFACGTWLGKLFPNEIGNLIRPTRQEVYYFATPKGSDILEKTPVWCDFSSIWENVMMYGIPATDTDARGRGFKIGEDVLGATCDPDSENREITQAWLERTKYFMAHRFPLMKDAPLLESRVCLYENTPDAHFIIDKLPTAKNVWILGGGSGHGYKMGAAIGEMMVKLFNNEMEINPTFGFDRFQSLKNKVERR